MKQVLSLYSDSILTLPGTFPEAVPDAVLLAVGWFQIGQVLCWPPQTCSSVPIWDSPASVSPKQCPHVFLTFLWSPPPPPPQVQLFPTNLHGIMWGLCERAGADFAGLGVAQEFAFRTSSQGMALPLSKDHSQESAPLRNNTALAMGCMQRPTIWFTWFPRMGNFQCYPLGQFQID